MLPGEEQARGRGTGETDLKEKGRERRNTESVVGEHQSNCTKPEDMFAFVGGRAPPGSGSRGQSWKSGAVGIYK